MTGRKRHICALAGLLAAHVLAGPANAQSRARIEVLSLFVAEPASTIDLDLKVGATEPLPKTVYVRIRGLPPSASLSEGFAVTPGVWSVPLAALNGLKVTVPQGVSGRSELLIALLDVDGKVLAEAKSALVVAQVNLRSALAAEPLKTEANKPEVAKTEPPKSAPVRIEPPKPAPKAAPVVEATPEPKAESRPEVTAPPPPPAQAALPAPLPAPTPQAITPPLLSPDMKQRNARMLEQGDKALGQGNIASARQFYLRAAEAGDGIACLKLAETYDPAELARLKAQGILGDPLEAKRWYERARDLGMVVATEKLSRLAGR